MLKRIGDWRLEDELSRRDGPFAVLFTEAGNPQGQEARLEVRRLARDYFLTRFFEVDLTENPALRTRFAIHRVPTLVVFTDGAERLRHAGADLRATLQRALGGEPSE
jgi:hypothetical protein